MYLEDPTDIFKLGVEAGTGTDRDEVDAYLDSVMAFDRDFEQLQGRLLAGSASYGDLLELGDMLDFYQVDPKQYVLDLQENLNLIVCQSIPVGLEML